MKRCVMNEWEKTPGPFYNINLHIQNLPFLILDSSGRALGPSQLAEWTRQLSRWRSPAVLTVFCTNHVPRHVQHVAPQRRCWFRPLTSLTLSTAWRLRLSLRLFEETLSSFRREVWVHTADSSPTLLSGEEINPEFGLQD